MTESLPTGIRLLASGRYRADFFAEGQKIYLGMFSTVEEAQAMREKAARAYRKIRPGLRLRPDNTSGVPGVSWHSRQRRWRARKKGVSLGSFETREEAVDAVMRFEGREMRTKS